MSELEQHHFLAAMIAVAGLLIGALGARIVNALDRIEQSLDRVEEKLR